MDSHNTSNSIKLIVVPIDFVLEHRTVTIFMLRLRSVKSLHVQSMRQKFPLRSKQNVSSEKEHE